MTEHLCGSADTVATSIKTETPPPRPSRKRSLAGKESETLGATSVDGGKANSKKPSYVLQREERDALAREAAALEAHVEALRVSAGLPSKEERAAVEYTRSCNFDIEEHILVNDLYLGRLQSLVANEMLLPPVNPLSTYIHLPRDMEQRRAILRNLQEHKLRRGIEAACNVVRHVDHAMPYLSEERFTSASGDYHCHHIEINQFRNFPSARALYDVFLDFLANTAVSVTAGLGQLALREDADDTSDPTIWNHRIVTVAEDVGCTEELNSVGFSRFYDFSPATNSPMGIVVYDTVNVDDLYPYLPHERTSKDVQTTNMIYELRTPGSDDVVVVLKQCLFCVQLLPQFDLAPAVLQQLQRNSMKWPAYIIKYLRDYVVSDDATAMPRS